MRFFCLFPSYFLYVRPTPSSTPSSHPEEERERDFGYKFWQVTAQRYWSLRKTRFYPKKVYQRGFLNPSSVFVVDGSDFTAFKFGLNYMAFLFLVGRNHHRHSYTSQSWWRSLSAGAKTGKNLCGN